MGKKKKNKSPKHSSNLPKTATPQSNAPKTTQRELPPIAAQKQTNPKTDPTEAISDSKQDLNKKNYAKQRAINLLAQKKQEEALNWLEKAYPCHQFLKHRFNWLFKNWPERAIIELTQITAEQLSTEDGLQFIVEYVLFFSDQEWEILRQKDLPQLADGEIIRQIFELLTADNAHNARDLLKTIGLRSAFREVRMFLRGLDAYCEQRFEEALKSFNTLSENSFYHKIVAPLLPFLQHYITPDHRSINDLMDELQNSQNLLNTIKILNIWGFKDIHENIVLHRMKELLKAKHTNRALNELSRHWPNLSPRFRQMLHRELPGALLKLEWAVEDIVKRISKTISAPADDPSFNRLYAILWQHYNNLTQSIENWEKYEQELHSNKIHIAEQRKDLMFSILASIQGQLYQDLALKIESNGAFHSLGKLFNDFYDGDDFDDDDDDDDDFDDYDFDDDDFDDDDDDDGYPEPPSTLPYWNKSVELLEKAISLHKDNKEYWHKLVNAYLNLDDESAAQKTIERAAQTVTDIPEFLILAANLALKKSAYDKGLRYINQAIELDPLNIEIRQTEAKLLCGKAQKRIGQKKITEAVALYQKAVNINQLPVEERAIFESELAALYVYAKRENDTLQLYQKSPIAHSVPWIWVYSHIQGLKRLGTLFAPKSKKTSKNIPSNMLLGPIPFSEEKAPPSEQELNVMLSLWFEEPGQSKLVLEYQILLSAILAGYNQIKQKKYLKYLVDFMNRSENQEKQFLTIAEYANEMAPNEFEIVLYRYEAARHFKKSKSYFVNAEQELHEALEQYSEDSTNISFMPTFDRNHFYRILRFSRLIEFINNDCQEETKKAKSKSKKKYGNSIY